MTLQLHRPDGEGGLEPRPVADPDWQDQLQSPRWGSGLRGGRLPELKNTEMNPTSRLRSVLFWLVLGAGTFVILVAGTARVLDLTAMAPLAALSPARARSVRWAHSPRARLRLAIAHPGGQVGLTAVSPILPLPCNSSPVSSTRTTARSDASSRWSTRRTRLEAEFEAPVRRGDPRPVRRDPRRDPRARRAR